jgi:sulfite oxidase
MLCYAVLYQVEGAGMRSVQLSLPQLQQNFKKVEFAATLECSGNRRAEMKALPAPGGTGHTIKGLDWDAGAIGTAVWGGVKLRDVLQAAGGRRVVGLWTVAGVQAEPGGAPH